MSNYRTVRTTVGSFSFSIVSKEEADNLVRELEGELLKDLSRKTSLDEIRVYRLSDNSILWIDSGDGTRYASLEDYNIAEKSSDYGELLKTTQTTFPKQKMLVLRDGSTLSYELLSSDQAAEKRALPHHLLKPHKRGGIYELADGTVLLFLNTSPEYYALFKHKEDYFTYEKHYDIIARNYEADRYLVGLNPYGKSFPDHVNEEIQKLFKILDLEESENIISRSSVRKVHGKLIRQYFDDAFAAKVILPLSAFMGEVQIQLYDGEWYMEYNKAFDNWTPLLKIPEQKHLYNIASYLYNNILNPEEEKIAPLLASIKGPFKRK